jgi:hypothetical protein
MPVNDTTVSPAPAVRALPYCEDGQVIDVNDGALYIVANPYKLDGRASSHPLDVRGFTTMNTFVLVEGENALVYSTGFTAHGKALVAQLRRLIAGKIVSIAIPRPEWASMCNARVIADAFEAEARGPVVVYQRLRNPPADFLDFHAGYPQRSGALARSELRLIDGRSRLRISPGSDRGLDFIVPELRLLPANWAYDGSTKTLFTGDSFCWVWQPTERGPWVLDDADRDPTTLDRLAHSLTSGRYWWLLGAETDSIRRALADMFDRLDIRIIAPDHGAILTGDAVSKHFALLDEFLAQAATLSSIGIEAGQWPTTSLREPA